MKRSKARVPFTSWCCNIVIGNGSRAIIMGVTYMFKNFVISLNLPYLIACLLSCFLMSFFVFFVLWLRLCVDMAVDRILRIFN